MGIDPKAEQPARDLLEHAIRGEFGQFAGVIEGIGEERFLEASSLCLRVAGYIAIDACAWRWPTDADVREIARHVAAMDAGFSLTEQDVYEYLARVVLRFEPLVAVFTGTEKAATLPFFATGALLVAYRGSDRHWWEYLDVIEKALEDAAPIAEETVPAVLLLARRAQALKAARAD